jgi:hypothetical protein
MPTRMLLFALFAVGCAAPVRTPTPAAGLDSGALNGAEPGERFFLIIFSSEQPVPLPAHTHTWAVAVRRTDRLEAHTISWLPATLRVEPLRFCVEPGVNLDLSASLATAARDGQGVVMWGPYEVRPSLYRRFLAQKAFLESGRVGYQCADAVGEAGRTGGGCNCFHAISDMDPIYGRARYPLLNYGFGAGTNLVARLHEHTGITEPGRTHDELLGPLGLCGIERRSYRR